MIDAQRVDVVSQGKFIKKDSKVKVDFVEGVRIVVVEVADEDEPTLESNQETS